MGSWLAKLHRRADGHRQDPGDEGLVHLADGLAPQRSGPGVGPSPSSARPPRRRGPAIRHRVTCPLTLTMGTTCRVRGAGRWRRRRRRGPGRPAVALGTPGWHAPPRGCAPRRPAGRTTLSSSGSMPGIFSSASQRCGGGGEVAGVPGQLAPGQQVEHQVLPLGHRLQRQILRRLHRQGQRQLLAQPGRPAPRQGWGRHRLRRFGRRLRRLGRRNERERGDHQRRRRGPAPPGARALDPLDEVVAMRIIEHQPSGPATSFSKPAGLVDLPSETSTPRTRRERRCPRRGPL